MLYFSYSKDSEQAKGRKGCIKMTYRDYMIDSSENLGWCKPLSFNGGSIIIARNEGEIVGIRADGEDLGATPENIRTIALRIDPDCDGDIDLVDAACRELPCRSCPWFDACCAMDDIYKED